MTTPEAWPHVPCEGVADTNVMPAGQSIFTSAADARVASLEARLAEMEGKLADEKKPHEGYVIGSDLGMTAKWQHGLELYSKNKDFRVHLGGRTQIDAVWLTAPDLTLNGMKSRIVAVVEGHELYLRTRNGRFDLHWVDPFGGDDEEQVGEDKIVAPLPGTVVALLAREGALLEKGAAILTLEVMKMEQTLRAPFAGVLKAIKCKVGDIVQEGVELAEIEPTAG